MRSSTAKMRSKALRSVAEVIKVSGYRRRSIYDQSNVHGNLSQTKIAKRLFHSIFENAKILYASSC